MNYLNLKNILYLYYNINAENIIFMKNYVNIFLIISKIRMYCLYGYTQSRKKNKIHNIFVSIYFVLQPTGVIFCVCLSY